MPKRILLVGHCGPDSSYLRMAVRSASAEAIVSLANDDTQLSRAIATGVDLLLVNRSLDGHFADGGGVELIKSLRAGDANLKMMLVSNLPDAQAAARAAGALPGFGKNDLGRPAAVAAIKGAL